MPQRSTCPAPRGGQGWSVEQVFDTFNGWGTSSAAAPRTPRRSRKPPAVKQAARDAILFCGGFSPWDEDTTGDWFDLSVSADQVQLARNLFEAVRPWMVACYDGTRWLLPTPEGWREQA
jgi:hypothetical protein